MNAWRAAGFTVSDLVMGHEVTFVRTRAAGHPHGLQPAAGLTMSPPAPGPPANSRPKPDLLLVACVKQKLNEPAPAKAHVSALFKRERAYAEHAGVPWFILSAEHGLVAPEERLAPYERYLPRTPAAFRSAWGPWVAERLELLTGALAGKVIEVHAGASYVAEIRPLLEAKGATTVEPLRGLSMGQRLSWYSTGSLVVPSATDDAAVSTAHGDAESFVTHLTDSSQSLHSFEFLALDGVGLRTPGLYSWWVGKNGADDLSKGLGAELAPGLIYAGLAGATRRPSGKRSRNTLWSRIAGMHLGGRHEFSTFRRSLGSILAAAREESTIDEDALTSWMTEHLRVVAVPYPDADTLGELEDDVLEAIDPPLNLKGMARTPIRQRLTELRRPHSRARS